LHQISLGARPDSSSGTLAQVEAGAAAGVVGQFGEGIGQAARAHVVDRQDRVALAQRPAPVDHLLGPALDLGVAALHGIEVELAVLVPVAMRGGRAAAHADAHARGRPAAPGRVPGGKGDLVREPVVDESPMPPANQDRALW
jgi:hypothetical protein